MIFEGFSSKWSSRCLLDLSFIFPRQFWFLVLVNMVKFDGFSQLDLIQDFGISLTTCVLIF